MSLVYWFESLTPDLEHYQHWQPQLTSNQLMRKQHLLCRHRFSIAQDVKPIFSHKRSLFLKSSKSSSQSSSASSCSIIPRHAGWYRSIKLPDLANHTIGCIFSPIGVRHREQRHPGSPGSRYRSKRTSVGCGLSDSVMIVRFWVVLSKRCKAI